MADTTVYEPSLTCSQLVFIVFWVVVKL